MSRTPKPTPFPSSLFEKLRGQPSDVLLKAVYSVTLLRDFVERPTVFLRPELCSAIDFIIESDLVVDENLTQHLDQQVAHRLRQCVDVYATQIKGAEMSLINCNSEIRRLRRELGRLEGEQASLQLQSKRPAEMKEQAEQLLKKWAARLPADGLPDNDKQHAL